MISGASGMVSESQKRPNLTKNTVLPLPAPQMFKKKQFWWYISTAAVSSPLPLGGERGGVRGGLEFDQPRNTQNTRKRAQNESAF
jgi:hypothetical protein